MTAEAATGAIAMLRAAVDGLLGTDFAVLSGTELAACFAAIETQRRRLEAVDHQLLAALGERDVAGDYGRQSVVDLLGELCADRPRVRRKHGCAPRGIWGRAASSPGRRSTPIFARVAAAQRGGALSAAHARVITGCVDKIPDAAGLGGGRPDRRVPGRSTPTHLDPRQLAIVATRLLATIDPDGAAPRRGRPATPPPLPPAPRPRRPLVSSRVRSPRNSPPLWTPILDTLSAPQPCDDSHDEDGHRDDRTPGSGATTRCSRPPSGCCARDPYPTAAARRPRSTCTIGLADLEARTGTATTDHGDPVSMTTLLRLGGACELVTTVLDRPRRRAVPRPLPAPGQPGATPRPGRPRPRLLLPRLHTPPAWSEAHHVIPWIDGGPTDLDNLCLLCGFHHREFQRRGWAVRMTDGVPEWTPTRLARPATKTQTQHRPPPPRLRLRAAACPTRRP